MKQVLFLLCMFLWTPWLQAQVYPVSVAVNTVGPHLPYLSYYGDQNQHLRVMALLTDFNAGAQQVRLRFTIEGPGLRYQTNLNAPLLPTYILEPGQPLILTGDDLLPFLLEENLIQLQGSNQLSLSKLPEGAYTICVDVLTANLNADVLSTGNCTAFFINAINPPQLQLPQNNAQLDTSAMTLQFSWWAPQNYIPAPGHTVRYRFYLYESVDPNNWNIFQTQQGLVDSSETFTNLKLLQVPFDAYLQPGYQYVWRVRAWIEDPNGNELDIITQNGYSLPFVFQYGAPPNVYAGLTEGLSIQLTANAEGQRKGRAIWTITDETPGNGLDDYTSYIVEYRKKPEEGAAYVFDWHRDTVVVKQLPIQQLEPEQTYEVRVYGRVNDVVSDPSPTVTFTTPAREEYACNSTTLPFVPQNYQPLLQAMLGEYWQLGQFEMEVLEVQAGLQPGRFSGRGSIRHDFLNGAKCLVRFTDMYVDNQYVVRDGVAHAITDGAGAWINSQYLSMVEPIPVPGVITAQGWLPDSTAFVVVNGDTLTFSFTDPDLPIVIHGYNNVEIQFWPDGTIVVTTYGTAPSADHLDATANFNVRFEAVSEQEDYFDSKQYDHFADNYEVIQCSGGYHYWVPNVSKSNTQTISVLAKVHANVNGYNSNAVSFGIKGGATLVSVPVNDSTFTVQLPNRSYSYQVYAYYDTLKLGKLNIVTLEQKERVVHLVPLQAMTLSEQAITTALNATFDAAQLSIDVVIDSVYNSSNFHASTTFSNPEVTGMQHYTSQMRALREEYLSSHTIPSDAYLVFVVPGFTDQGIDGYMVRGKGLGFVKAETDLNSFAHTLAHELGHGIGGLAHAWGEDETKQGLTNNLMDYSAGQKLTAKQWKALNEAPNVISLLDGEEDASWQLLNSKMPGKRNADKTFSCFSPAWQVVVLPANVVSADVGYGINVFPNFPLFPSGTLTHFTIKNSENQLKTYQAKIVNGQFEGYYNGNEKFTGYVQTPPQENSSGAWMMLMSKVGVKLVKFTGVSTELLTANTPSRPCIDLTEVNSTYIPWSVEEEILINWSDIKNSNVNWEDLIIPTVYENFFNIQNDDWRHQTILLTKAMEYISNYPNLLGYVCNNQNINKWIENSRTSVNLNNAENFLGDLFVPGFDLQLSVVDGAKYKLAGNFDYKVKVNNWDNGLFSRQFLIKEFIHTYQFIRSFYASQYSDLENLLEAYQTSNCMSSSNIGFNGDLLVHPVMGQYASPQQFVIAPVDLRDYLNTLSIEQKSMICPRLRVNMIALMLQGGETVEIIEKPIVSLFNTCKPGKDAVRFLLMLKDYQINGKSILDDLLTQLDDRTFFIGSDNFTEMCQAIVKLYPSLLDKTNYTQDKISYYNTFISPIIQPGSVSDALKVRNRYMTYHYESAVKRLFLSFVPGNWTVITNVEFNTSSGKIQYQNTLQQAFVTLKPIGSTVYLDPFEPIVYDNEGKAFSPFGNNENPILAPTILLMFAEKKAISTTAKDLTQLGVDIATLAIPGAGSIGALRVLNFLDKTSSVLSISSSALQYDYQTMSNVLGMTSTLLGFTHLTATDFSKLKTVNTLTEAQTASLYNKMSTALNYEDEVVRVCKAIEQRNYYTAVEKQYLNSLLDKEKKLANAEGKNLLVKVIDDALDHVNGAGSWLDNLDVLLGSGTKTKINGWINNGLSESKLQTAFANSTDKAGLLSKLETSKSIYHQRVHIADWDNIPGIMKSNYTSNGLTSGKTHAAWNNPALDLPSIEAANFVNASAVELPAGTKIYRVTGGNPAGAYWTIQKPNSVGDVIGGTAVQPAWNDFSKIYVYEVPEGQTLKVWQGTTARQRIAQGIENPHLPGGDQQLFIPDVIRDNAFKNLVQQITLPW